MGGLQEEGLAPLSTVRSGATHDGRLITFLRIGRGGARELAIGGNIQHCCGSCGGQPAWDQGPGSPAEGAWREDSGRGGEEV